jgi:hypothetical protein
MRFYVRNGRPAGYSYGCGWAAVRALFWLAVLAWPFGLGLGAWAWAIEAPWLAVLAAGKMLTR